MTTLIPERVTARIEGDFVVFLIGMRINRLWKVHKWGPAAMAMTRMLKELSAAPPEETGFLGHTVLGLGTLVQYWRSFEDLDRYARSPDRAHFPAWSAFNKRAKNARDDVGIWHETYLIQAGNYENVYSGMPQTGLGRIVTPVPATGALAGARQRLRD